MFTDRDNQQLINMVTVLSQFTHPIVAVSNQLKMTKYSLHVLLICVIATITGVTGHPPASSETQRTCFNSFDNFDECWEKIEELCLNEATGEFEECFNENTGYTLKEEDSVYSESFPHSQHCYKRSSSHNPYYDNINLGYLQCLCVPDRRVQQSGEV